MFVAERGQMMRIGTSVGKQTEHSVPNRLGGRSRQLLMRDCLEQCRKRLADAPCREVNRADPIDPLGEPGILGTEVMDGAGVHAASLMQSGGPGSQLSRR